MSLDRPIPTIPPRPKLTLAVKLAACLCHMTGPDGSPLIPNAKQLTTKQIIAAVEFHHDKPRELMGTDHPSNLLPLTVAYYRAVQTPVDAKTIAKVRHVRKKEVAHREQRDAKRDGRVILVKPKRKIRSRPFPPRGSRPFPKKRIILP